MINREKGAGEGWVIAIIAILFIGIISAFLSFNIVKEGSRGVVLRVGEYNRVMDTGLNFKIPFLEKVTKFNVRTVKIERQAASASKDLQTVTTDVALNYHLEFDAVGDVYKQFKKDYQRRVIDPTIQDAVKATTAQFNAEELITKRAEVKSQLKATLVESLSPYGITVDDINITNFAFSAQFDKAIEAKVEAEQKAFTAQNDLKRIEFESQQIVVQAEAEAEAIRIQANAINSQGGEDYVNLQAVAKWNGILPIQMIPGSTVPFLNLK